jgi:HD superfamily phosphohydrolase
MDAKRLSETKGLLKKRNSVDRSAPMTDDAAHPGSGSVLRAISVGHFELNHVNTEHDASKPMLEEGTGFHTDVRPAVFAEVQQAKRNSLKSTKSNDRSDPVIDKWVHIETQKPTPRKSVIDELKEKKGTIEAMHTYNEHHTVEEISKYTKPGEHSARPHAAARMPACPSAPARVRAARARGALSRLLRRT